MLVRNSTKQKPDSSIPKSTRKHDGVRTPKARNAIVRDQDTGTYSAEVDAHLVETLNGLSLRLNAVELSLSQLRRDDAVGRGYAAPTTVREAITQLNNGDLPNNVVPMDGARQRKEQSKAAPVNSPGNEAEQLVLPVPDDVVVVKPATTVVPKPDQPAANDAVALIPEETLEQLNLMTDESPDTMLQLAEAYGMDIVECSRVLFKHYERAEAQCYKDHGIPRDDVKAARYKLQRGVVECDGNLLRVAPKWQRSKASGFKAWNYRMRGIRPHLEALARETRLKNERSITDRAPFTKGEAEYRRKALLRSMVEQRVNVGPGLATIQKVHRKLYVPDMNVTTSSQLDAITTWGFQTYNKARKLLGMQPKLRRASLRARYETLDALANVTDTPTKGPPASVTVDVDHLPGGTDRPLTQAEYVRRCVRNGATY